MIPYCADKAAAAESSPNEQQIIREQEVAKFLICGDTHKKVTWRLNISPDSLRQHVKHIYTKLQVNSREQLISEFK